MALFKKKGDKNMKKTIVAKNLLTTKEAANFLRIPARTLENWRCNQRYDLPYVKLGRIIRYRMVDLENWVQGRLVTNSFEI